jgi:hypothetical protein
MSFFKDLIAFFKAIRLAVKGSYAFEADPKWWLTKNNEAYASAIGNRATSACAFFWVAFWLYPFYVIAGRRVKLGAVLTAAGTVWLVSVVVAFLITRDDLREVLLFSTLLAAITALMGVTVFYSKPVPRREEEDRQMPGFRKEFARSPWWKKPFVVVGWALIFTVVGIAFAILAIPWLIFDWLKDNQCPFVKYPDTES